MLPNSDGSIIYPRLEGIMARILNILSASVLVVSTCAFAQSTNMKPTGDGTQKAQPGSANADMSRAAEAGTANPASGSLMQRREKAMSAGGAAGASATDKVKQ